MKKLLLTTLLLTVLIAPLGATPNLKTGPRYHIVCQQFPNGCVTDGATAGQQTPLYYLSQATTSAETYWLMTEERTGCFSIKNARTGQYITYDGVRDTWRRYVSMTTEMDGDNSLWMMEERSEGYYAIRCVAQTNQVWDTRTDSYMVGTYSRTTDISSIETYSFFDEQNNRVGERSIEVTDDGGLDVSSWLDATTDAVEGWQTTGGWFLNTGAGGAHYNNEDGSQLVAPFIENWHESSQGPLEDCSLQQTLSSLPAGRYTLQADMMAVRQSYTSGGWWGGGTTYPNEPATGVVLFAGNETTSVATDNDPPQRFSLSFTVTSIGDVAIGVRATATNANWIAIDNIKLAFQGTESELLEGERQKVEAELSDYYSAAEIEAMLAECGDDFDALEQLRKSVAYLPAVDPLAKAAKGLAINGQGLSYVESLDLYLCSIPLEQFGQNYTATIDYELREGFTRLTIGGMEVVPGGTYTFSNVKAGRTYTCRLWHSDGSTVSKPITFTSLPVVKLYGSFNDAYSEGSIMVYEPDKTAPQLLSMKAKWRGGITNSNGKHKRNYHVKLKDADGNKLEKKFFGLRNDNSWILEACQVDMSRIRNRVLTDLWNDYSTPPYYIEQEPKALTGTRGRFVELILNDEYRGIYCMTENLDRKQMKLKKYDELTETTHGQLWKSKDWSYAVFMGHNTDQNYYPGTSPVNFNDWSESWDQYYVKYPDFDDVQPTEWQVLYDAVNFVCTASDADFAQHFSEYFDLPLVIDYYILMETILSTDNHGKNMFFGVYDKQVDKRITFSVWDMDATSGQRWSDDYYHSNLLRPEQDYATFISNNEHGDYNLFKRLRETDADDFNMRVRLRYRDLRQNYLATENILERFRTYLAEFKTAGTDQREYARWNGDSDIAGLNLNFDTEMTYIDDWFTRRMNYLDTQRFDIAALPTGITGATALQAYDAQPVYNLSGQQVGTRATLRQLPVGIYIVGGKKVVVKE